MSAKCGAWSERFVGGYQEACGLEPDHAGFHKSNHVAWPSNNDPTDWANVGLRLLCGNPDAAYGLSLREIEYAIAAANAHDGATDSVTDSVRPPWRAEP